MSRCQGFTLGAAVKKLECFTSLNLKESVPGRIGSQLIKSVSLQQVLLLPHPSYFTVVCEVCQINGLSSSIVMLLYLTRIATVS